MLTSCGRDISMGFQGPRQEIVKRERKQQLKNSIDVPRLWCTAFLRSSSKILSESSSIHTIAGEIVPLSAGHERKDQ